ncbi:MAG: TolC family protein [Deltaproteobacteria bacterium]|nr:TolC family protein [Deltaproteobacteria bacterium]
MGLPESEEIEIADKILPALPPGDPADLDTLIAEAAKLRPEWDQLMHGKKAAEALAEAERGANLPVLFLAGVFTASWAPSRYNSDNPYHYDPYNELFGGVALGLQLNLDPALAAAKADKAEALAAQVEALARFAATGIPLRVRKAHQEVLRFRALVDLSDQSVKASRKWMTFAAAAYTTGTGEARDVLEGVAAYVQAKKSYYESLQSYHVARAALDFAVGR